MISNDNIPKIKSLIALAFLCCFGSGVIAATGGNADRADRQSPEASAAEAKLSFEDLQYLEEAFIDATPGDRDDGVSVGELGVDGGNRDMIIELAHEIADSELDRFDSLLIAKNGKLLFESYFRKGRIDLPHPQASATKTYTGLALGRAIQMGYLTMADLDKPLVSFLEDLDSTKFVDGVGRITLRKALTMRGGLRVNSDEWKTFSEGSTALKGQALAQALLEQSAPITAESQSFSYGNFNPELVMQVVDAVVPGTARDFIKNELLDKMGITNYAWQTAASGLPEAGWRASMTSRDMVKFGILAMNKGRWNGEQLISEAFIAEATSRIIHTGNDVDVFGGGKDVSNQGYGYFWWSADLKHGNKSYFSASAQGGGGQFVILVEELDLIVVITAHDGNNTFLQTTAERILPAFIQ